MPLYIVMYKSKCQAIVLPNKNKLQALIAIEFKQEESARERALCQLTECF